MMVYFHKTTTIDISKKQSNCNETRSNEHSSHNGGFPVIDIRVRLSLYCADILERWRFDRLIYCGDNVSLCFTF